MTYALYNVAATVAAPLGAAWLALNARHRPLLSRFAPSAPVLEKRPLWVHACSVGEINTARPILTAIRDAWPGLPIVLTVSTVTGRRHADSAAGPYSVAWCPFDHPWVVRRFVTRLRPRALLLTETEIWPNMLRECRRYGAPVALVNGRFSDTHYPRYARWREWLLPVIQQLSMACVQNEEYADRLAFLGMDASAIHVTGNTKFDAAVRTFDPADLERLRRQAGIDAGDPVLIFGSVRTGDEDLVARCWRELREEFPSLHVIIAPRHIDRLQDVLGRFHEPVLLRSETVSGKTADRERVLVVDTMGELVSFYAIATVAVIGGSFYPGVNGHNPLESAALGIPTVFGAYMRNFIDPARELVTCGGARQVESPDALPEVLSELLREPSVRKAIADRGQEAVAKNRGSIRRTLRCVAPLLGMCPPESAPNSS
ncbi:MAG: 3-deoxy-D-manno-octulosonic acid transferase [Candidatus Hydrogenedentes bacterium]|nr:3-deoxy-D-manno-octulosonic acid transferase [Candidatus Hydrogenedentota bacterium]